MLTLKNNQVFISKDVTFNESAMLNQESVVDNASKGHSANGNVEIEKASKEVETVSPNQSKNGIKDEDYVGAMKTRATLQYSSKP